MSIVQPKSLFKIILIAHGTHGHSEEFVLGGLNHKCTLGELTAKKKLLVSATLLLDAMLW